MKKISMSLRAIMTALVLGLFFSCDNDVKRIEVDNQFALSLFADTIRIGELLNSLDSTASNFLRVTEEGEMFVYFADSVKNAVKASDIMSGLQDISFSSVTEIELPTVPPSPAPVPMEVPFDDFASVPFEFEGYEINSVVLNSGRMYLSLSTDLSQISTIKLSTDDIRMYDGSSFEVTMNLAQSGSDSFDIDLTECEITPVNNAITFSALIVVMLSDQGLGGAYKFEINGGISDVNFKSIDGGIRDTRFDFIGSHEFQLNFPNLSGDLKLATPEFSVKYVNSFGFSAEGFVDSLYLTDTDGNDYSMIKDWNEVELSLQPTGNDYGLITDLDEALIDEIDILRDYSTITFNGNIVMGCENVSGNMIDQDSHIDIIADLALPLKFNIENLLYTYTMPFNLSLGMDTVGEDESSFNVENVFDELEFKFVFENALPVQIEPQLYMLQNGTVIDSLFSNDACIHGYFGGELVQDIITVRVVEEKLDNVQLADQLMMKINFSSLGNTVTINTNDYFNLRLGLKTKTSEINMEDFNF